MLWFSSVQGGRQWPRTLLLMLTSSTPTFPRSTAGKFQHPKRYGGRYLARGGSTEILEPMGTSSACRCRVPRHRFPYLNEQVTPLPDARRILTKRSPLHLDCSRSAKPIRGIAATAQRLRGPQHALPRPKFTLWERATLLQHLFAEVDAWRCRCAEGAALATGHGDEGHRAADTRRSSGIGRAHLLEAVPEGYGSDLYRIQSKAPRRQGSGTIALHDARCRPPGRWGTRIPAPFGRCSCGSSASRLTSSGGGFGRSCQAPRGHHRMEPRSPPSVSEPDSAGYHRNPPPYARN